MSRMTDGGVVHLDGDAVTATGAGVGVQAEPAPPLPRKLRVDWCVMGATAELELELRSVASGTAGGVGGDLVERLDIVPSVSVSRNEWDARPGAMQRWVRTRLEPYQEKRPLVLLDDESVDVRADPAKIADMQRWRAEFAALFPWADVGFYGPWEASAELWQITQDKRRGHQRQNNALPALLKHCPRFNPSLYLNRPQASELDAFNLDEFVRIFDRCTGQLGGLGPRSVRPVISPFVDGEPGLGQVDDVELTRALRMALAARSRATGPICDGFAVWGWIGYESVQQGWLAALPMLARALTAAAAGWGGGAGAGGAGKAGT